MVVIRVFIASSISEFESERTRLRRFFFDLNRLYAPFGIRFQWDGPENISNAMSKSASAKPSNPFLSRVLRVISKPLKDTRKPISSSLTDETKIRNSFKMFSQREETKAGSQDELNLRVSKSDYFFIIVGKHLGEYSLDEYRVARKYQNHLKIVTYFLHYPDVEPDRTVKDFKSYLDEAKHYYQVFDSFDVLEVRMLAELLQDNRVSADLAEKEGALSTGNAIDLLMGVNKQLATNRARIEELKRKGHNNQQIIRLFEENEELVVKYRVGIAAIYDYADYLFEQHDYDRAIAKCDYIDALVKLQNSDSANSELNAAIAELRGKCYEEEHDIASAEVYYRKALKLYNGVVSEDGEADEDNRLKIISLYARLASMLSEVNRPTDAENLYKDALKLCHSKSAFLSKDFKNAEAGLYNNMAVMIKDLGRYDEAETLFRKAKELFESGDSDEITYVMSNNCGLAQVLEKKGNYDEAETLLQNALTSYNNSSKEQQESFVLEKIRVVYNLARILPKVNKTQEAINHYRNVLSFYRSKAINNPDAFNPHIAMVCNSYGSLLYELDKYSEAESLLKEAVRIRKQLQKTNDAAYGTDYAVACFNLAGVLKDTDRPEEAIAYYRSALDSYRRIAAINPIGKKRVAETCAELGRLLINLKRVEEAYPFAQESVDCYQNLFSDSPDLYASALGMAYWQLALCESLYHQDYQTAKNYAQKSLELFKMKKDDAMVQENLRFIENINVLEMLSGLLH